MIDKLRNVSNLLGLGFIIIIGIALWWFTSFQGQMPFQGQMGGLFSSPLVSPINPSNSPLPTVPPTEVIPEQLLVGPSTPPPTAVPTPTSVHHKEIQQALQYISQKYNIPVDDLVITDRVTKRYPLTNRIFQIFRLRYEKEREHFDLMIDIETGEITEDISAAQKAEDEAYRAKYGKFDPPLYDRLQTATDDDVIDVVIWMVTKPVLTEAEIFAELAAEFPQAKQALEEYGKPFDIEDPETRATVWEAYKAKLEQGTEAVALPLITELETQGYTVTVTFPIIGAHLPKHLILDLTKRHDVGAIYLNKHGYGPSSDSGIPTDRIPFIWERGFDGTGRDIAILESGNIDFNANSTNCPTGSNNCFRHPGQFRWGIGLEQAHTTLVASAAASDHAIYKGAAPGVTIHSAGMENDTDQALIDALKWALSNVNADVINASVGHDTGQDMDWVDRSVDYWARTYFGMIIVAAGNNTDCANYYLCTPAKAWNVISVGAYDDHNNAHWQVTMPQPIQPWLGQVIASVFPYG